MTIDLTGAQIFILLINFLILCLAFFIRLWMTRQQADIDSAKKSFSELEKQLNEFKLLCSKEYAQRSEFSNGRTELMEAIHIVSAKVDRLFEKFNTKADKS
ncbi:hypothetical protein [Undibacterium sp. SXout11W]|uniref:hypothetical protein n=1 Tax=Undibacterium sp. SXout11W TaxID=3413050 RepID=UPI003BF503A0